MARVRPTGMMIPRQTLLALVGLGALLVVAIIAIRLFGGAREIAPNVWDRASLPERLQVCGRSYRHDTLDRIRSAAEVEDWQGFPPTVVQPLQVQPCSPRPCTDVAQDAPCDTVVWVRVEPDAYVDYALQGGP